MAQGRSFGSLERSPNGGASFKKGSAPQTACFKAATAKHFTTVLAGFALTFTILPKISLLPAFVAGFFLVLIMQTPGRMILPVFFTSFVMSAASAASTPEASAFFMSQASAIASATAPFVIDLTGAFIAFMPFFMGAIFIVFFPSLRGGRLLTSSYL